MGQTVTGGHHSSTLGDTDIEETGTLLLPVPLWMHLIQHIYTGRISDVVSYKVKIITHVVKISMTCFISIRFLSFCIYRIIKYLVYSECKTVQKFPSDKKVANYF